MVLILKLTVELTIILLLVHVRIKVVDKVLIHIGVETLSVRMLWLHCKAWKLLSSIVVLPKFLLEQNDLKCETTPFVLNENRERKLSQTAGSYEHRHYLTLSKNSLRVYDAHRFDDVM